MNKHSREHSCDIRHKSSETEKFTNGMSEKVQIIANKIYKEFERLIAFYGSDVVEYLMPLIVSVLENLEDLYRTKQSYELELELLKDDNSALNIQYEKEKICKKQAEERVLHIEYAYEGEKNQLKEKLITAESANRLLELKTRNSSDTIARLEEKVQALKTENQKLYERYTDVLKSHAEQLNRIQADAYRDISPISSVIQNKVERLTNRQRTKTQNNLEDNPIKKSENVQSVSQNPLVHRENFFHLEDSSRNMFISDYISRDEETMADILANDQWIAEFDESCNDNGLICPSNKRFSSDFLIRTGLFSDTEQIGDGVNEDPPTELNNLDIEADITDDEFGIGREIECLIRENQELVATKNALNVVKDDLINRLDLMTSENDVLREDVNQHSNREADLKAKVTHLEHELRAFKEELLKSKELESSQITDPLLSYEQKSFSRTDMAILLQEKNYYKEKLMELQDAVVYKEMCRIKQQFPELKESTKPVKVNNPSIWNLFNHLFKKEDEMNGIMDEKSKNLISRFRHESDRSQLYSWSVPRSLIESTLPKRIPIPIKIQTVFEPKDVVICATMGYEESQSTSAAQYLWCLVQSNMKNNKNYYLYQMCLTEKVPELTSKYSISLQFSTVPFTMTEVPATIFVIRDFSSLINGDAAISVDSNDRNSSDDDSTSEKGKPDKIFQTKVQMKPKSKTNIGSKTLWFGCEKNQVVVYILLDNNKVEIRLATLTMDSEIDFIRYHYGRVLVIQKNGCLGIFDLNKEMNQWELNQCLLVNISDGLPISDSCCDVNTHHLWMGSSTVCSILNLSLLRVDRRIQLMDDSHLTDQCTSIESMAIVDRFSLMLVSVSRIGLLLGYDLKNFQFKLSIDLKPSVFDLIEPICGMEKSALSLFHLTVDNDRIWMATDSGMTLVVTLDTLYNYLHKESNTKSKSKASLPTDNVYISSHAFAQHVKIISLLSYSSTNLCLENANSAKVDCTKEIQINNKEKNDSEIGNASKIFTFMTAIGSNYVNLNNSVADASHRSNHAIIWKI